MIRSGGIDAARQLWIKRQLNEDEPDGTWTDRNGVNTYRTYDLFDDGNSDKLATRYTTRYNWKPTDTERAECCDRVIAHHHHSLFDHCKSANHIAHLFGVSADEVYQAKAAIDLMGQIENKEGDSGDALYNAIRWLDEYAMGRGATPK